MSLRKERNHMSGISNIDFRSKSDTENINFYSPWLKSPNFGTMNTYNFKLSFTDHNKLFKPTFNLNEQKYLNSEIQNPKIYNSAQFYKKHHIKPLTKSLFTNERIANLDESYKGKELFIGDSMMISDITKQRKERKKRRFNDRENKIKKIQQQENIAKDKTEKNKEAFQETQLVKIEAKDTLEGKVDIKKLKEIRLALRRRYASRTDFRKIFKEWARSMGSEITVYDAHNMINNFSIPINFNETRALIASSNQRGTENLNLKEFFHLIFGDNDALEVDLKKLEFKEESVYDDDEKVEDLKKNMKMNIIKMNQTDDLNYIEKFLKTKKPAFINNLKLLGFEGGDKIDFDLFKKTFKKFNLPERYLNDEILHAIFDQFKDENNLMKYNEFLDKCVNKSEKNDFFNFQDKYINFIQNKIEKTQKIKENQKQKEIIEKEIKNKNFLNNFFLQQIEEKNKLNNLNTNVNDSYSHMQPSTNFINNVFKDHNKHFEKLNEIEKSFSPLPSLIKEIKGKTRFGANKIHNSMSVVQPNEKSALFIDEKKRFDNVDKLVENERYFKFEREKANINKRKNVNKLINEQIEFYRDLEELKDSNKQFTRTKNLYEYEVQNRLNNFIIED